MGNELIIDICDLEVDFHTIDGIEKVLQNINLVIHFGEIVGLVGETGCGKSVTTKVLLGILPIPPALVKQGEIHFLGQDLLKVNKREREHFKESFAYVPQDPTSSLNPVFSIGTLMIDMIIWKMSGRRLGTYLWKRRRKSLRELAENYAKELLEKVHIPRPKNILTQYPSQLSGGMRQRVLLAMAMIGKPKLILLDEPTTALDVTLQKRYLHLIQEKVNEENLSGLYITHNLGVARTICNRTYVMYAGNIVESGGTSEILDSPFHPYTQGLVNSIPKLTGEVFTGIGGQVPNYLNPPQGCRFHPRCHRSMKICFQEVPKTVKREKNRWLACWLYQ